MTLLLAPGVDGVEERLPLRALAGQGETLADQVAGAAEVGLGRALRVERAVDALALEDEERRGALAQLPRDGGPEAAGERDAVEVDVAERRAARRDEEGQAPGIGDRGVDVEPVQVRQAHGRQVRVREASLGVHV